MKHGSWYGFTPAMNVRFDTQQQGEIIINPSMAEFSDSVDANLPDPNLRFASSSTGSDIFSILRNFVTTNSGQTICGTRVFLLISRAPNENEIFDLLTLLQKHHIFVYSFIANDPTGGSNQQSIFQLSALTNGLGVFVANNRILDCWDSYMSEEMYNLYPIYAYNFIVQGNDYKILPDFYVGDYGGTTEMEVLLSITIQDRAFNPGVFQSLTLEITEIETGKKQNYQLHNYQLVDSSTLFVQEIYPNDNSSYRVTFAHDYHTDKLDYVSIRVSLGEGSDYFPPYSSFQ